MSSNSKASQNNDRTKRRSNRLKRIPIGKKYCFHFQSLSQNCFSTVSLGNLFHWMSMRTRRLDLHISCGMFSSLLSDVLSFNFRVFFIFTITRKAFHAIPKFIEAISLHVFFRKPDSFESCRTRPLSLLHISSEYVLRITVSTHYL